MCRNIKTLHNFQPPATDEEIRASAIQFVRKLSGFTRPSKTNGGAAATDENSVDRAEALRAISQRLHRDEVAAFRKLKASWLDAGVESLWREAEAIAASLESRTRVSERAYAQTG